MIKEDIKSAWNNLSDNKANNSIHHAQMCILRAMMSKEEDKIAVAKHLLRKAFTPVSKTTKLAGGRIPFDTVSQQFNSYRWGGKHPTLLGVSFDSLLSEEEIDEYHSIAKEFAGKSLVRRYSYFFTRQDIFEEYQLVQTAHAALELGSHLSSEEVQDLHFTCCGVEDLEALESVERVLTVMKVPFITFKEPDIGNEKTAIGVYPIEEHKRGVLRSYNLLRFRSNEILPDALELVDTLLEVD
jgi:hypothetical protein